MADKSKSKKAEDDVRESEQEKAFEPPPEPPLPSKDGRKHRATYAKKKDRNKNVVPGYNVRVDGPNAHSMSGRWVPVTRIDGTENMEFLRMRVWAGEDDDTGAPVAIYEKWDKPKKVEDEIPF